MNRKFLLLVMVGVLLVIASFALTRNAAAVLGCFTDTNGTWAETYICWLKDNGISTGYGDGTYGPNNNVTRAEMAAFLYRANKVPPQAGQIVVSIGPDEWEQLYTPSPSITPYFWDEYKGFTSSNTATYTFVSMPDFPTILYGRQLSINGIEYCYTTISGAYINRVAGFLNDEPNGGNASYLTLFQDTVDRSDVACRYYSFTQQPMDDHDMLSIWVEATWTTPGTQLRLGRVSLYLVPTATQFVGPASLGGESGEVNGSKNDFLNTP